MGYKVDFDALDSMYNTVQAQVNTWNENLAVLSSQFQTLINSKNMSGKTAKNIREYIASVHMQIVDALNDIIGDHVENCLRYKTDMQKVDESTHACIKKTELTEKKSALEETDKEAISIGESLADVLSGISDIFSVSYNDISSVDESHKAASNHIKELDEKIQKLEKEHLNSDFLETEEAICKMRAFISDYSSKTRAIISPNTKQNLLSSNTYLDACQSIKNIQEERKENEVKLEAALEAENARVEILKKEYEERKKEAEAVNFLVDLGCIVGSAIIIAATGGAAIPLVMGVVSATSSAIMAGTENLTQQYVEKGNLNNIDWGSFGKDVILAGASGFITGYGGTALNIGLVNKVSATTLGSALLDSPSAIVSLVSHVGLGAGSETLVGVFSRGTETLITEGDQEKALKDAFDPYNMLMDASIGGIGGAETYKKQTVADLAVADYNQKYNPVERGETNGLENLKKTTNGGVDFSESDYILKNENGDIAEVQIKPTGSRSKDATAVKHVLKENGFDVSGMTGKNREYSIYVLDDYDVATDKMTVQVVQSDARKKIGPHAGAAKQYGMLNGKYEQEKYKMHEVKDIVDTVKKINDKGKEISTKDNIDTNVKEVINLNPVIVGG